MRFQGFIGPSYTLASVNVDCQRCMNLYPEVDALGTGKEHEVASLVSTPGLTRLCTLPASPVRGIYTASNGSLYAVGGNKLYSISSSWVATEVGTLATSTGAVSFSDNGNQLVLVDGSNGYFLSLIALTTTTTATAGSTTTLTNTSTTKQVFTGTSTQTVILPAASSLSVNTFFYIENQSSQSITVQTSDSVAVQTMAPNSLLVMVCIATSGSGTTPWRSTYDSSHVNGSSFIKINDPNFLGANQVNYLDGFFIFNKPSSQTIYCSDLLAVTFNALNFGAAQSSPDNVVGHVVCNQTVYVFGSQSAEAFYDAGTSPFPLARIQGAVVQVGCAATFSIAIAESTPYWIGGDKDGQGIVYRIKGSQPERVSTPAVEASIRSVGTTNVSNARAWTYQQGGHVFYCLNVPGLNSTWVYDVSTGMWHERTYLGSWGFERHRVDCAATAYGYNVAGDYVSGNVYKLDSANYTDNGTTIVRMRTAPHFSQDMKRIFHSSFQLDMETGVGLDGTAQGTDPQAILTWSDDGGHTWSSEKFAPIGKIGEFRKRLIWRRLGASRDRVYKLTVPDPVKVTLIGAELEVDGGAN